jgi:transcriptional regulator with XRE-family HTH domain
VKYYRDDKLLKALGKRIREIRLSKNFSQEELAYECGLEYSQINRIELGKINTSVSHLYLIAQALKITPQELLP